MEQQKMSLGNYLRQQREAKNMSIDEASIETNIAKKYIEALENDEYGFFPAEMYVTGFLTTYVEVLEMDKEFVLSMYQRSLAKEQEAPLEEVYALYRSENTFKKHITSLMIALPVIIIITLIILFVGGNSESSKKQEVKSEPAPAKTSIFKADKKMDIDLSTITSESNQFTFGTTDEIKLLKKDLQVGKIEFLGTPNRQIRFRLNNSVYNSKEGDILNASLEDESAISIEILEISSRGVTVIFNLKEVVQVESKTGFSLKPYSSSIRSENVIAPVTAFSNLTMRITATAPIWIEYEIDGKQSIQKVLINNQVETISFSEYAKLLIGNSGKATISFAELTNVVRGGTIGETSYSIFYRKVVGQETQLVRTLLK